MGAGEYYSMMRFSWESKLPKEARKIYDQMFPRPPEWRSEKEVARFQKNGLYLQLWRSDGTPKYTRQGLVASGKKHNFIYFSEHKRQFRNRLCPSCFSQ